jgi:hypothetical protein
MSFAGIKQNIKQDTVKLKCLKSHKSFSIITQNKLINNIFAFNTISEYKWLILLHR